MRLVLADDLTGACDSGVQFVLRGYDATVAFSAKALASPSLTGVSFLALDTGTRLLQPREAGLRLAAICSSLAARYPQPQLLFKKMDSSLRGNPGAELAAIMAEFELDCAFVAPAYPEQGRTVVNGLLMLAGTPVNETAFAHDPVTPVREAAVAKVLQGQTDRKIANVARTDSVQGLAFKVRQLMAQGAQILVFDADCATDLRLIAETGLALAQRPVFAGAAGLARALAECLPVSVPAPAPAQCLPRTLFVCGSAHHNTHAQVLALAEAGVPCLELPALPLSCAQVEALAAKGAELVQSGSLALVAPRERVAEAAAVSKYLAKVTLALLRKLRTTDFGLCLTGGETAATILAQMGDCMRLERELLPGIVKAQLEDGPWSGLTIVTKAGGFGAPEALVDVMNFLSGKQGKSGCPVICQ